MAFSLYLNTLCTFCYSTLSHLLIDISYINVIYTHSHFIRCILIRSLPPNNPTPLIMNNNQFINKFFTPLQSEEQKSLYAQTEARRLEREKTELETEKRRREEQKEKERKAREEEADRSSLVVKRKPGRPRLQISHQYNATSIIINKNTYSSPPPTSPLPLSSSLPSSSPSPPNFPQIRAHNYID